MTMNADLVRSTLVKVLEEIQADSGLECPPITGTTKPLEQLPEFDSKIWPIATGMLATKLGITIANDISIFTKEKSCIALTIDETVAIVLAIAAEEPDHSTTNVAEG